MSSNIDNPNVYQAVRVPKSRKRKHPYARQASHQLAGHNVSLGDDNPKSPKKVDSTAKKTVKVVKPSKKVFPPIPNSPRVISDEQMGVYRRRFSGNPKNQLIQNILTDLSIKRAARNYPRSIQPVHTFSHTVSVLPSASNQRSSGRCWIFAGLNLMRAAMIKQYNLDKGFELSQSYLFFCDKMEKANIFMNQVIDTKDEGMGTRKLEHIFDNTMYDGGYWTMFTNLVNKYGVVPESVMPDSRHARSSGELNDLLKTKLKQNAMEFRRMAMVGASVEELQKIKQEKMGEIYKILASSLGTPPARGEKFVWKYKDEKSKDMKVLKDVTPISFYRDHVPYNVSDKVLLINSPIKATPYHKRFTVDYSSNMEEGNKETYLNLPSAEIIPCLARAIKGDDPIWFGCDVGKFFDREKGTLDMQAFDYSRVFDVNFRGMSKAERMLSGASHASHAMVISGVDMQGDVPVNWRVQNSWGKDSGEDGNLDMTTEWLAEYGFDFVIDKQFLSEDHQKMLDEQSEMIPAWGVR
ncbi:Bleomycin hydrolase [Chlamydiales bacterium SCGC AG-110-M15]|nr:Bleomycin hydrolase [Chlamydiales bacterium SCGC AG-110-M15]